MAIMDEEIGQLLNYRELISSANEFGRLANGVNNRIKNPTNTIQFIQKSRHSPRLQERCHIWIICVQCALLASTAEDFPPSLWDRLLPQTEITLNLLRQYNATPTVSAYVHLCGPSDYNKTPLAPMGCAVQVHEKTDKWGTWAYHSVNEWYLSTSPKH